MIRSFCNIFLAVGSFVLSSGSAWSQSDQNTVLGYQTGNVNLTGGGNTLIGYRSGMSTTSGYANVFIGNQVGYTNTVGYANVFIGNSAGFSNTNSVGNVFLGNQSGYNNSTGSYNLFMGNGSGQSTTTGAGNVAIGDGSLLNNSNGTNVTSIGRWSGMNQTTGQNNTFIGTLASSGSGSGTINNATAIGFNASVTASNSLILGNGVNVGIGNTAPANKLEITQGTSGNSGLRFTNLTNSSPASVLNATKFLSVNSAGDVILATTGGSARMAADLWSVSGDYLQNTNEGGVIIGSSVSKTPKGYKLFVEEGILTEKVKVSIKNTTEWSDYVFKPSYKLQSLTEVANYIQQHEHLPGIPSAVEVVKQGIDVAKMDAKLLEKIEELTLYLIQQKGELEAQRRENQQMKERLEALEKKTNH